MEKSRVQFGANLMKIYELQCPYVILSKLYFNQRNSAYPNRFFFYYESNFARSVMFWLRTCSEPKSMAYQRILAYNTWAYQSSNKELPSGLLEYYQSIKLGPNRYLIQYYTRAYDRVLLEFYTRATRVLLKCYPLQSSPRVLTVTEPAHDGTHFRPDVGELVTLLTGQAPTITAAHGNVLSILPVLLTLLCKGIIAFICLIN